MLQYEMDNWQVRVNLFCRLQLAISASDKAMAKNPILSPKPPNLFFFSSPSSTFSLLPYQKSFNLPLKPNSSNSLRNYSTPPGTECPVPLDQQPIIEYQNLSTSFPFSWASGDLVEYASRLLATGLSFGLLVGLPVSWFGSVGSDHDQVKVVLGSLSSGVFVVTMAVLRMYLGWAYVGNRLLSATVECNLNFVCLL